jgi:hypothetical protein
VDSLTELMGDFHEFHEEKVENMSSEHTQKLIFAVETVTQMMSAENQVSFD